jgi:hypothetical protein
LDIFKFKASLVYRSILGQAGFHFKKEKEIRQSEFQDSQGYTEKPCLEKKKKKKKGQDVRGTNVFMPTDH